MNRTTTPGPLTVLALVLATSGCTQPGSVATSGKLSDAEIDNLVRRSYPYVAMYNVISQNEAAYASLHGVDGFWNRCAADTQLKDHEYKAIARPNNDTLYAGCVLDLRAEPVIVEYPAFDSDFVALETSAYDHYCEVPLSTTRGDFQQPTRLLYYTERTEGYSGEPVEGVDQILEMTGDFVVAFLRAMPHAAEPERMEANLASLRAVEAKTLSEYLGADRPATVPVESPFFGSDFEVFEGHFLEVMQFVFNHTTFDPNNPMDQGVLAAFVPLGVEPGKTWDPSGVTPIDGQRFAAAARAIQQEAAATWSQPDGNPYVRQVFLPKGKMTLEPMVVQSAYGPIGLPAHQAVYPGISTADGQPMNALNDYVLRMSADEMPPAHAFWSVTLYDTANGFFIPNDGKKYSVGENGGMQLDEDGGIAIYVAAEPPEGVPAENWLPINRGDEALDLVMRIYAPDLQRLEKWTVPQAEKVSSGSR